MMLRRNIDTKAGLVNGTIGTVVAISAIRITSKFDHATDPYDIERVTIQVPGSVIGLCDSSKVWLMLHSPGSRLSLGYLNKQFPEFPCSDPETFAR